MRSKPFIFQLSGDLSRISLLYWHSGIIISVTSLSLGYVSASRRASQQPVSPGLQGNQQPPILVVKQEGRKRDRESIRSKASVETKNKEREGGVMIMCRLIPPLTDKGMGYKNIYPTSAFVPFKSTMTYWFPGWYSKHHTGSQFSRVMLQYLNIKQF